MKRVKILTVCGAGVVSSTMIAEKLKEDLSQHGYSVEAVETNPGGVAGSLLSGGFDLIANVTPMQGDFDIPVVDAMGYFTGFDEESFIEKVVEVLDKKYKTEG